jgi:hypothetical protein
MSINYDEAKATIMMEAIFEELDVNHSERVDFIEFVTAAIDFQTNLSAK